MQSVQSNVLISCFNDKNYAQCLFIHGFFVEAACDLGVDEIWKTGENKWEVFALDGTGTGKQDRKNG